MLRRAPMPLLMLLAAHAVAVCAIAGMLLGLRVAGPMTHRTAMGDVRISAQFAWHGSVDAYVPLADWGVRVRPYRAPLRLHAEPLALNRDAVTGAAGGDRDALRSMERDLAHAGKVTVARAGAFALGGAGALGGLGVLVLMAAGRRDRRVLMCAGLGVLGAATVISVACGWRMHASFDPGRLTQPTFFARGAELRQLLDASERAQRAGESYQAKAQTSLRSLASLLTQENDAGPVDDGRRVALVSDLHSNVLALRGLRGLLDGREPVFMVGDFGRDGSSKETDLLVGAVGELRAPVIAVSGNHDSARLMARLAGVGVTVLGSGGQRRADGSVDPSRKVITAPGGLTVAGFSDPLEWRAADADAPGRVFSFSELGDDGKRERQARRDVLTWFDGLPQRPDIVLIHQNGLAQRLAADLHSRGDTHALTVLTGHDHAQHVHRYGPHVVVDAGTLGAGGLFGIGKDSVGVGRLHFARAKPTLRAVDLVAVEPVGGASRAQRVVVEHARCERPELDACRLDDERR